MQRIAYLLVPDFQVMVFSSLSVFELANHTRAGTLRHTVDF